MGGQSIRGNRNVQIQDVDRSLIEITYNDASRTVPLEPALIPVAKRLPSPARLVRAHSGIVPYVDRGGLLGDLANWIDGETPFAGQVIGGRGGSGKTRLAVELCQVLRQKDWLCGFLSRIADPAMLDALVQAPTARLVVVDYAESRVEQLELLLPLLKASADPEQPVRVLLLTRTGPAHAKGWSERLRNRIDALDAVLDECDERILEETPLRDEEKVELFQEAAAAFAGRLDPPAAAPPTPSLAADVFSSPLMVVIAAYLAAHGSDAPPPTRAELLDEVVAHERRYWRESSDGLGADEVLLERMVALATLASAESEAEAAELLRLLPDLEDAPAERRNRLARWVRDQYPGPRWWNPLEPDLVGEHLVADAFTEQPDVLRRVLEGRSADAMTRPLEALSRAAADHAELTDTLRPILSASLEQLGEIAVAQAETAKDQDLLYGNAVTAASALAVAIETVEPDDHALSAMYDLLPRQSNVVLNELAVTVTAKFAERRRREKDLTRLAGALNDLCNRLADIGRHEEALAAAEESVHLFRQLTGSDPAQEAGLAMALSNLCNRLADIGRHEEALAASEESVAIYRQLAAANSGYSSDLANALNNLCNRLVDIGRREEALPVGEEAVGIYRQLAAADPSIYNSDLAMGLSNLCNLLAHNGRLEEALAASEESVAIYRQLAAANPAAYAAFLSNALNNLCIRLGELDRHEEALTANEESVAIRRQLAAAHPAAYSQYLASALNNLGIHLGDLGRHEEGLAAAEESVSIRRQLAAANPAVHEPHLASALNNLSSRLAENERLPEALVASEESLEIRRQLAAANPAVHEPHLAGALNNFGIRLANAERHEEGLAALEESVEIHRSLAAANPAAYSRKLLMAFSNFYKLLKTYGRDEKAERVREEITQFIESLTPPGADQDEGEPR